MTKDSLTASEQLLAETLIRILVRELKDGSSDLTSAGETQPPEHESLLLRPAEVATKLRVSRTKVYELIASGAIPSMKVGNSVRVPLKRLEQWIESQCPPLR